MARVRSAYFASDAEDSEEDENSFRPNVAARNALANKGHASPSEQQILVHSSPKHSEFPITSYILWDRSPLAPPIFVASGSALPPLLLTPESIASLLETMNSQQNQLAHGKEDEISIILTAVLATNGYEDSFSYVLQVQPLVSEGKSADSPSEDYCSLSIPVSIRHYCADVCAGLAFENEQSASLVRNLERQICSGRNHALRTCLRMRSAGFLSSNVGKQVYATLRFEAIFPNESFQFIRVRQPPLLSTPLSLKLTALVAAAAAPLSSSSARPRFGYLTLNKTRKVVPLLETDPAVSLAPLVGLWVSLDSSTGDDSVCRHPFVLGACVRFLKDLKVRERVLVDEETFLFANFSPLGVQYFEVSRMPRGQGGHGKLDFGVADFMLDLTLDRMAIGQAQIVVGQFKPMQERGPGTVSAAAADAASGAASDGTTEVDLEPEPQEPPLPEPLRVMSRPYGEVQALRLDLAKGAIDEPTPLPREMAPPQPSPSRDSSSSSSSSSIGLGSKVLTASLQYQQAPGLLRSSLTLSQSDGSPRSSLESFRSDQLMRINADLDGELGEVDGSKRRPRPKLRVVCTSEEEAEEAFEMAVEVYARYLGIEVDREEKLLDVAREALQDLPPGWELGISEGEDEGIPFFFDTATNSSVWLHPKEALYLRRLEQARAALSGSDKDGDDGDDDDDEYGEEDYDEEDEDEDEDVVGVDVAAESVGNDYPEDDDPLLSAAPMRVVTDNTDLRLSTAMRRLHFPTNPLASLQPCVPVLRPGGEEDSLLLEAGLWGMSRLSSVASSFESEAWLDESAFS